jgi:hemerythrin-like domain-containing protein
VSLTRQLRDEHDRIRRRLRDWDDLLVELESGVGTFAALRLKEEAHWVRSEVLPHLDAEESIVFSLLSERAPDASATLRRLSDDHAQLRELIAQLTELAWRRQLGTATNSQAQELLKTLRWRLLDHIAREDGALPPLLLQTLSADEDAELLQRWQEQIASVTSQLVSDPQSPVPSLTLTDLNGRIHAWLDECLLRHLEALTALDLEAAKRWWRKFSDALMAHAQVEDSVALPVYERLGNFPEGGQPSLFDAEHKGIERMLRSLTQRLESLSPNDPSLRRRIVVNLDRYMLFRHLIEHHTLREQNIFYPLLDEKVDADEKERIKAALQNAIPPDFQKCEVTGDAERAHHC